MLKPRNDNNNNFHDHFRCSIIMIIEGGFFRAATGLWTSSSKVHWPKVNPGFASLQFRV